MSQKELDKEYISSLFKAEPDGKQPLTPKQAVELIENILCCCSGEQLCIIAEQLDALKRALDRYE